DVPQIPLGLGVQLIKNDGREGISVLRGGLGGVNLQHSTQLCVDFFPGIHSPAYGVVLRLAEAGVLHHVLGSLIDLGGILLVTGEDTNLGAGLSVIEQVIQAKTRRKLGLAVLLGQFVIQKPPVAAPCTVLVLFLHPIKVG